MKARKIGSVMALMAFLPMAAMAAIVPGTPNGGEPELYDIYNTLYGTTFSGSNDPAFLALQTGQETFPLDADVESITFDALWRQAFMTGTPGYYTLDGSNDPLTLVPVLGPFDNVNYPNSGQGPLTTSEITVPVTGGTSIGFYLFSDNPNAPGQPGNFFTWYSQPDQNNGQPSTQDGEVHVLILTTPFADTYLLAFEDLPYDLIAGNVDLGDSDYQDLLVQFTLNRTVVPEPSSMALLGIGLAGLAVRRFKKMA